MQTYGGSQRRKKKQGIPQQPCDVRRKRGRLTAGPPLLSFSCVPQPLSCMHNYKIIVLASFFA